MSTADANNIGIKLQAAGENLNTWGDPNLNNDLIVLSNLVSKWNPITINASVDINTLVSNYSTTNADEVATIKLVQGSVSGAFNVTFTGRAKRILVWNATNYTATLKLSATSGFALPASRYAEIATDGSSDVYNLSPNYIGTGYTISNLGDVTNKQYVDTAIATAGLPATSGAVLNSGGDTTAGFLSAKVTASNPVFVATSSPGGNEKTNITVGNLALQDGGLQLASFTAFGGFRYRCPVGGTITLPTATGSGNIIVLSIGGAGTTTLSGKINGASTYPVSGNDTLMLTDYDNTQGWI